MSTMTFRERMESKEMRHAYQLIYSIDMITEIPISYNETVDSGQMLHAVAMIDAFYVHLRLLGDFLVKETKSTDIGPADFGVQWRVPKTSAERAHQSDEAKRLLNHWDVASKYVVHFGHVRVPNDLAELEVFDVDAQSMTSMAVDALTVLAPFVKAVEDGAPQGGSNHADGQPAPVPDDAKLLIERATLLRTSFDRACDRLGLDPASLIDTESG